METVRAIPIDGNEGSEYRVVFGVGAFTEPQVQQLESLSERRLTIDDLFRDSLGIRKPSLDPGWVLKFGIPEHIRPFKNQYVPVFRYLDRDKRIQPDGTVDYSDLPPIIQRLAEREIRFPDEVLARFHREIDEKYDSPLSLLDSNLRLYFVLVCWIAMSSSCESAEALHKALVKLVQDGHEELSEFNHSNVRRTICHLDRLQHDHSLHRSSMECL